MLHIAYSMIKNEVNHSSKYRQKKEGNDWTSSTNIYDMIAMTIICEFRHNQDSEMHINVHDYGIFLSQGNELITWHIC